MKWFALILLFNQADWTSSCIFDKVKELKGSRYYFYKDINTCFASCYENVKCIGIVHWKNINYCSLLAAGDDLYKAPKDGSTVVYSLLRDDVDPTCQTFVNF